MDTKDRIRALIRAAPDSWPGAPIRWLRLAEQPALNDLIESGEVQCVDGANPYEPWKSATFIRFREQTPRDSNPADTVLETGRHANEGE